MLNRLLISFLLAALIFASCKDDDSPQTVIAKVNFNAKFQADDLVINDVYTDPLGNSIRFAVLKFYVSDLALIKDDNSRIELTDVDLIDFNDNSLYSIEAEIEEGSYKSLEFGFGVNPAFNAQDPSAFSNDHPLSAFANTFWSWADKYKFAMIEGDVDTDGSNTFPNAFIYHTGLDTLYRNKEIPVSFTVGAGGLETIDLTVQAADIFFRSGNEIDYISESTSHTTNNFPLAIRVTENLLSGIY